MEKTVENNNIGDKALKAGIWYTISSILVKTITILTTPIFTRMMTTYDYGLASTFSSWYTLLMIFCSLNLTYSVGRAKLDFPNKLNEYVGSMQILALISTTIIGIFMIVFRNPLAGFMEMNANLVLILVIYLVFAPSVTFTQTKFRYSYKYKGNIAISIYITLMTVFATLGLMFAFETDRYYAKVLGAVVTSGILSIGVWINAIKKHNVCFRTEYWKYGLAISAPLILHSISLNILSTSDRIMITKFAGADYTGIYTLAYSYAILINIILGSVNEAWLPWFHDTLYAEDRGAIKKNVKPLVVLGCMMGIGCIAIAPEAMLVMGPKEYSAGQWAVAPVAVGLVCQFIYQQYVHIELHYKKTKYISMGTIIAAALNLILNLIFIPRYGFLAAAYTTLFCYLVLMVIHFSITKFLLKQSLYDDAFMFFALAVTILAAVVFMLLYKAIIIRFAVLIVLCVLYLLTNKKYILGYISKRKGKNNDL